MHLGALAVFSPDEGRTPGPDALLELLGTRAAAIPRLRMRVRDVLLPVGGAAWSVDKDFDVHRHVMRVEPPGARVADEAAFMAAATGLAGELMEQPLRRGLPPWQMYVIGGAADGPFAVLVKLHHALADGMRAVAIGAGIFDEIASSRAVGGRSAGRPGPDGAAALLDARPASGRRSRARADRGPRPGLRRRRLAGTGRPPRSARRDGTQCQLQRHPPAGHRRSGPRRRTAHPPGRGRHVQRCPAGGRRRGAAPLDAGAR